MKKIIILTLLSLFLIFNSFSQNNNTSYIGINLIPLLGGNTLELGYENNIKPYFSIDIYAGYTFNTKLNGLNKIGDGINFSSKSGAFLKIGARLNTRRNINKFAPFIGVNIVNAIAIEKGSQPALIESSLKEEKFIRNSYNIGLSGIIGITSPANKRISADIGIQIGQMLKSNLISYHSYMPGMGVNSPRKRVQGILRVKYRIK